MALDTHMGANGVQAYVTRDGDMLDQIAFLHYGDHKLTTELLYEANRHLADYPLILPQGVVINLPARPSKDKDRAQASINLWD